MFFCSPSIVIFQKYCRKLNASILLDTTQTSLKNHFKKNNLRHFCLTFKQSKVEIICLLLFNQLKNCCNLFSNLRIRKSNFYYLFKITWGRFKDFLIVSQQSTYLTLLRLFFIFVGSTRHGNDFG